MKRQRGFGLSQLIGVGIVIVLLALLVMRVFPSVMTYYTVLRAAKATAAAVPGDATVGQVRAAFGKYLEVDTVKRITASDVDIYKENGKIVVAFEYEDKLPLFGPVSLLIEYAGSSAE